MLAWDKTYTRWCPVLVFEILKHKEHVFSLCRINLGNGENVRFWEDRWVGYKPLKNIFPVLYNICFDKNTNIVDFFLKDLAKYNLEGLCLEILCIYGTTSEKLVMVWSWLIKNILSARH